jgi:hypothetical protein
LGQGSVINVVETDARNAQDAINILLRAQTVPPGRVKVRRRNYVRRIRIYLPGLVTAADRRAPKPIGILILKQSCVPSYVQTIVFDERRVLLILLILD